jgi:hypothetical protein
MILLYSDLCLDRNEESISILEKEYSFELCFEIINNGIKEDEDDIDKNDYGLTVRHAFTRLMITLWIDR